MHCFLATSLSEHSTCSSHSGCMVICVISMLMIELLKPQIHHCSSVTALARKHKTLQRTEYCLLYLDLKSVIRKGSIPQTQLKSFMIEEEIKCTFPPPKKKQNKKSTALESLYCIKRNKTSNGVFSVSSPLHKQTNVVPLQGDY